KRKTTNVTSDQRARSTSHVMGPGASLVASPDSGSWIPDPACSSAAPRSGGRTSAVVAATKRMPAHKPINEKRMKHLVSRSRLPRTNCETAGSSVDPLDDTDNEREKCGTFEQCGHEQHGAADVSRCFGLPGDALEGRSPDLREADSGAQNCQAGADRRRKM